MALVALVDFIYTGELTQFFQCLTLTVQANYTLSTVFKGSIMARANRIRHRLVNELINGADLQVVKDVLSLFSVITYVPVDLSCNYTHKR